jgi:hypothetical protein
MKGKSRRFLATRKASFQSSPDVEFQGYQEMVELEMMRVQEAMEGVQ